MSSYNLDVDPTQMQGTVERGNILATSLIHMQPWASSGECTAKGLTQKVLIKLYDEHRTSYKLNDVVTFVGILEYTPPTEPLGSQDSQMKNFEDQEDRDILAAGVPNADKLPHLHSIFAMKNTVFDY